MNAERTFRLTLAYDGTSFSGWQRQPGRRTVQGELERALSAALEQEVTVQGAGRTDAGVHARGQVASLACGTALPARAIAAIAGRSLPADLRIVAADEAPEGFHARHSALARCYRYHLLASPDLLSERFAWWPRRPWQLEALRSAASPLAGEHDCSAFETQGSSPADPVCRIHEAVWTPGERGARFDVRADHFLYRMVRNLIGTMLAASAEPDPARYVRAVLDSRDRTRAGPSAEPQGLSLERVEYATRPEDAS